jgi:UDP-glucuronate 4-epimerase
MSGVLVTGGAGFIGSHVAEKLLAGGEEVVVLDNFNDAYDPAIKRANAAALKGARIVEGDIRNESLLAQLFDEHRFDSVVHLAAMAGVRPSLADPLHYADVNVHGTLVVLEEIKKRPQIEFLFASSSSVYGSNEKIPFKEDDDVQHPVSPYAATKRAGELLTYTYHHVYGIPSTCLRFFTVYGPRQRPEMAIHKFVDAVHKREPIPVFGDGSTRRDYTYIDDIVDGVIAALDRCAGYEIFNLGESATTSLSELVDMLGEICGRKPILDRQPLQPGDVPLTCADITKSRRMLAYQPHTPVAQGLRQYVAWHMEGA